MIAHPIQHDAALVLEKLGGEVSNFAARQLTSRIASDADLVLTMTRAHRDTVLELAPRQLHRTFTLSEAARLASECNARNVADLAALRPYLARARAVGYSRPARSKRGVLCDGWFRDRRPPAADTRALPTRLMPLGCRGAQRPGAIRTTEHLPEPPVD